MFTSKIGFSGQWKADPTLVPSLQRQLAAPYRFHSTTPQAFMQLTPVAQYTNMTNMIVNNTRALREIIRLLGKQPEATRMYQIPSDILPLKQYKFTEWIYSHHSINDMIINTLMGIRTLARHNGVRLFMQTRPFTNISSEDENIAAAAIADIESHARLAHLMGFSGSCIPEGFCLITNVNAQQDPQLKRTARRANSKLSEHARNIIVFKNNCITTSIGDLLSKQFTPTISGKSELTDFPLAIDLHAVWVKMNALLYPWSEVHQYVYSTWRGHKPISLYSQPDNTNWPPYSPHTVLNRHSIYGSSQPCPFSDKDLSKRSKYLWNLRQNKSVALHLEYSDILVEAKANNLAQMQFYDFLEYNGFVT